MKKIWNFGIIGPGKIANRFAAAFQFVPQARVHAIASRDNNKAREFAELHHVEKCYSSYLDIVKDPAVDAIYVATPHPFHHDHTILALSHGKAVICEKPMAMNSREVSEMVAVAKTKKVFLMEGMWSRFFPAILKAQELIASGVIGEIKFMNADFGFSGPVNPDSRLYNLALGGGAQLDVGVYPMFGTLLFLGKPSVIKSFSQLAATGADVSTTAIFQYANGAMAHIFSSIIADSPKEANIMGTLGRITLHAAWHKTEKLTLRMNSGEVTDFPFPHSGNGFEFQLEHVVRCLDAGRTESDLMSHSMSLLMAEVSDEIRKQGGIKYSAD